MDSSTPATPATPPAIAIGAPDRLVVQLPEGIAPGEVERILVALLREQERIRIARLLAR